MKNKKPLWQIVYPVVAIVLFVALNVLLVCGDFGELKSANDPDMPWQLKYVETADLLTPKNTNILKVVSYVVPDAIAIIGFMSLYHFIKRVRKEDKRSVVLPALILFVITPMLIFFAFGIRGYIKRCRDAQMLASYHRSVVIDCPDGLL